MKVYFKEVTTRDYSRVGYDNVSITASSSPFGTEEGQSANAVWYFVELSDAYSKDEAMKLASKAISKALSEEIGVKEALFILSNRKKRKKG